MSRHVILATIPHGPKDMGAEVEAKVSFIYITTSPPQVDFISARHTGIDRGYGKLEHEWLDDLARDWLETKAGYQAACEKVAMDEAAEQELRGLRDYVL
jgi:hypothetical protein